MPSSKLSQGTVPAEVQKAVLQLNLIPQNFPIQRADPEHRRQKLAKAEDLIDHFPHGSYIGWSGFTGVGYPK